MWSCVCRCSENIFTPIHYICHIAFQPSVSRTLLNQEFKVVKLKSSLWKFYDRLHDLVNRYGISMSKITTVSCVFRNHKPVLSQFMTYHPICNKSNTRVQLVAQELLTLPEHLSSPWLLVGFVLLNL
jgi:hypothetical protein